jgi:hypothetical protein
MMSAMSGEDPNEPLPSFASEDDDAYNVPTKVGAMAPEIAARLRAEGLLPEEESQPGRPSAHSRPTPIPSFASEPNLDAVTSVYSELSSQEMVAAQPWPPPRPAPPVPSAPPPERLVQTPVAFVAPPSTTADATRKEAADAEIRAAFGGHSQKRMLVLLLAGMAALIAFAFLMALLSQRG